MEMIGKKEKEYLLFDLGCTAALVTSGYEIIRIDKTGSARVGFVFLYSFDLESSVNAFWNDKLSVDARRYFENIKMLKTRIYSDRNG